MFFQIEDCLCERYSKSAAIYALMITSYVLNFVHSLKLWGNVLFVHNSKENSNASTHARSIGF